MRQGLEEVQSKDAGRRTGTGSEVWYIRDEWARDHEVLHPERGVLYKSGVYALKVTCLTLGDLRGLFTSKADTASPVGDEQLVDKVVEWGNLLTALRKSRVTKAVYYLNFARKLP